MYYLAKGDIRVSLNKYNFDYTLEFIKNCCSWQEGVAFSSIFPSKVYPLFLEEVRQLKNSITYFTTGDYKEYDIPFYFLLKDNEIIACAAQQIIDGKLQEVEINWYI